MTEATGEYHCPECGALFDSAEELGAHRLQTGHAAPDEGAFRCQVCGQRFGDRESLQVHRAATNHEAAGDKLECPACGFVLQSEAELRRHRELMHFRAP